MFVGPHGKGSSIPAGTENDASDKRGDELLLPAKRRGLHTSSRKKATLMVEKREDTSIFGDRGVACSPMLHLL